MQLARKGFYNKEVLNIIDLLLIIGSSPLERLILTYWYMQINKLGIELISRLKKKLLNSKLTSYIYL